MPGSAYLASLYAIIEDSSRRLNVTCSRETVWPILNTYRDIVERSAIAFRVETSARRAEDLSCRFTMIPADFDPYAAAVSGGLITATGHPAGSLLSDIQARCVIDNYGIDFGVAGGFTKSWQFFPPGKPHTVSDLGDVPSMPSSVTGNAGFFTRYGVGDKVCLTGIDYKHKTANLYFGGLPDECLGPAAVRSMLHELRLPEPSERLLRLSQEAVAFYATLDWDSPRIARITFAVMTSDPMAFAGHLDPRIERFARNAPHNGDTAGRKYMYYIASSPRGEYSKLLSFYQWQPRVKNLILASQ